MTKHQVSRSLACAVLLVWASLLPLACPAAGAADASRVAPPAQTGHTQDLVARAGLGELNTQYGGFQGSGGRPQRSIPDMTEGAAWIVRASVVRVADIGEGVVVSYESEAPVRICSARLAVDRVIKGAGVTPGDTIEVEFYKGYLGPAWGDIREGQHGLFFIAEDATPFDLFYPFVALPTRVPDVPARLPPLEAVEQYLLGTLAPEAVPELLATARESVISGNRVRVCKALESAIAGLLQLESKPLADALVRLSEVEEVQAAGLAFWGLVKLQDHRAFPAALDFAFANRHTAPYEASSIVGSTGTLTDPALAPAIKPLLNDPKPSWRHEALQALRRMKNPEAIPWVIPLLSDTDVMVTYNAVMCLAETTGRFNPEWATSVALFEQDPSQYTEKWADWWESEGKAVYGAAAEEPSGSEGE
jgi:hypothetical protein